MEVKQLETETETMSINLLQAVITAVTVKENSLTIEYVRLVIMDGVTY